MSAISLQLGLLSYFLLYCPLSVQSGWQENVRPKLFFRMGSGDYESFDGNATTSDSFSTLLPLDDNYLLLGGRNLVYKLQVDDGLRLKQKLLWHASDTDKDSCLVKGKTPESCQNYIKVLQQYQQDRERFMICGTNAFKPLCREYVDERGSYVMSNEKSGLGLCPFSPYHNSTAVLVGEDLFAGTVADLSGVDPIIFRQPLRTRQYDSTQLNSPHFVGSFSHEDYVYFFFREGAVEYINCGKAVFSRVARVCKDDQGGPNKARNAWTSYLKTRLNCSVPGNFPFYFDEIQSVTRLIQGTYGGEQDRIIYASFSTPPNSIGGSAICAFRLRDISDAFSGSFKEQRSMSANWLPVPEHKVPSPRPGTCNNDTKSLPDSNLNFIKTHTLMDDTVAPFFGAPVIIRTGLVSSFTTVAVDPQVKAVDGKSYDVIFIGTTTGRVLKAINALSADSRTQIRTVVIEELQVFAPDAIIRDIKVIGSDKVAVMSADRLVQLPVQRCDRASNCQECVALQDPYCAWDVRASRCASSDWTSSPDDPNMFQSIPNGHHPQCPPNSAPTIGSGAPETSRFYEPVGEVLNVISEEHELKGGRSREDSGDDGGGSIPGVQVVESPQALFSLETLVITVSSGAVAALVVGFVTGYCCGRRCRKEDSHLPYAEAEYEYFEQRPALSRPLGGGPLMPTQISKLDPNQEEVTYAEPELVTGLSHHNQLSMMGGGTRKPLTDHLSGSHYSSSLLASQPANKFNTIHSSMLKRNNSSAGEAHSPGLPMHHYESAGNPYARGRDNFGGLGGPQAGFHLSTLGRSRPDRSKFDPRGQPGGNNGELSSSGSSSDRQQQVIDSAYGTTRSVKKVYL